jgi:3-methyladenine DNA glycosylase AlkC
MQQVSNKLNEIEKEHPEFFKEAGKSITDYITKGVFSSGVFINTDLPIVITNKIRKTLDEFSLTRSENT